MMCVYVCMYVCNDQNEYCIAVCTELKEQAENDPNFISNFITGDESWVFGYNSDEETIISVEDFNFTATKENTSLELFF